MNSKNKQIEFLVGLAHAGIRLDKVLASIHEISTRSRAAKLLNSDLVKLSGKPLKPSYLAREGDLLTIEIPIIETNIQPLDMKLDIYFEDQHVIVINKPAGLVVHPAEGHPQDTLVNALLSHTKDLSMGFNENRPGIVHRLDKDTSGLLVVAKNDFAHEHLSSQFRARTVHRVYWALTWGNFKTEKGTIKSQLARHPNNRKKFSSHAKGGKTAITHYEQKFSSPLGVSLLHVKLETGRTHQIRVQMSEAHHPIVGDLLYGGGSRTPSLKKVVTALKRISLHAAELGFVHPVTGEKMIFKTPWPEDLTPLVDLLEIPRWLQKN